MSIKDTPDTWETLSTRRPFQGAKTAVDSDMVRMPDGSVVRRDYQVHPGSVCVLALDGEGRVLVIRQYRHPVRRRLWELPAGLLDVPGENPLHAAQRELYEEAHVKAGDWRVLADFFASPGGSDEAIRIFLARDVAEAEGERYTEVSSEEADMEVAWADRADLVRGVLAGELGNPALVTGVLALTAALAGDGLDALRPATTPWPARPYEA
ncbi:NUDIX hydrolase [Streptomyces sp. NBC_00091]|uniref:NUDIX domain-containing protein n=1 Tax=Streptomyces sp. NBC_00091 TaxID=2975648 RepID=UPI00225887E9|nr:NUDIX hydrolase [Streptomyces sp. NBC_00091]MCX5379162.1 NUDIX hydrolase [Streptomyces sp. NBC_00091]